MFEVHPMGICSKIVQDSRLDFSVVQHPAGVQHGAKVKQKSAAETINALFRGQRGNKDDAAENTGRSKCSISSVSASEALCSEFSTDAQNYHKILIYFGLRHLLNNTMSIMQDKCSD